MERSRPGDPDCRWNLRADPRPRAQALSHEFQFPKGPCSGSIWRVGGKQLNLLKWPGSSVDWSRRHRGSSIHERDIR